jgi:hypothetical protein
MRNGFPTTNLSRDLYSSFAQNRYAWPLVTEVECVIMKLAGTNYRFVVLALVPLAFSGAVPASAASHAAKSSRQLYLYAPDGNGPNLLSKEEQTSSPRVAAIRECNAWARRVGSERDWQAATYARYGACMLEHDQRFG